MRLRILLLLCAAVAPLAGCAPPPAAPAPASGASALLRQCGDPGDQENAACYEAALLEVLASEGVRPAMDRLEELAGASPEIRRDGHVYAHAIGLAAYTDAEEVGRRFAECTPAFQSGCYHGVIQSYFAAHVAEHGPEHLDAATVDALCEELRGAPETQWQLFQCAHGLGHGLTMVFDHQLPQALEGCDLIASPWEREGCYGGVFMENIVQATTPHHSVGRPQVAGGAEAGAEDAHAHHHAAGESAASFRALDPAEPLYPCTVLDARYLNSCYQMQTSAILFFNKGDMAAAFRTCDGAPAAYRTACYQSMGRDISAYTVQDHSEAVRLCSLGDPRYQPACHTGYAKNLVDLTARPADGFAYCRSIPQAESKRRCYEAVGEEIWVLAGETPARVDMCEGAEPEFRGACRRGAGLPEPQG